jgi:hypothetical protein
MISFLVPTRNRPDRLQELINSVFTTASHPEDIEFIIYIDDDDHSYDDFSLPGYAKIIRGPRKNLAQCYLWKEAEGPIYCPI